MSDDTGIRLRDGDTITLTDHDGRCHMFIVRILDPDTVLLSGFSRTHVVSMKALTALMGNPGSYTGSTQMSN